MRGEGSVQGTRPWEAGEPLAVWGLVWTGDGSVEGCEHMLAVERAGDKLHKSVLTSQAEVWRGSSESRSVPGLLQVIPAWAMGSRRSQDLQGAGLPWEPLF